MNILVYKTCFFSGLQCSWYGGSVYTWNRCSWLQRIQGDCTVNYSRYIIFLHLLLLFLSRDCSVHYFRLYNTICLFFSGILEREQEQSVVYGSIDFGKTIVTHSKYLDLLQKAGNQLKILPHKVEDRLNSFVDGQ